MRSLPIFLALLLGACAANPFVDVPSENASDRVDYLVLHFTSENFAESLRLLTERTDNPVSAHYLVPALGDVTYPGSALRIYRLVDESRRAWHAGQSYWYGEESLNDRSIGIEIVNQSRCETIVANREPATPENQSCRFDAYDETQLALVAELVADILARYPGIDPVDIIGHADIAPDRRVDPGPRFPWKSLHERGIGAWYDEPTRSRYLQRFRRDMPNTLLMQRALRAYGYRVEVTGENDPQYRFALRAFQMHFRPSNWSAYADAESAAILFALIDKYRPDELAALGVPQASQD